MKAFIVSLVVIVLFTSLIIINAIYINRVANDLISVANSAKIDTGCEKLSSLWESKRLIISLCAHHKEIDKIEEQILLMQDSARANDYISFDRARVLLVEYIDHIRKHERVTLDNIL